MEKKFLKLGVRVSHRVANRCHKSVHFFDIISISFSVSVLNESLDSSRKENID